MMMAPTSKVTSAHLQRLAYLYVRQSSLAQVHDHRESTARQYDLKRRAHALGWAAEQIVVIDEDLGLSGASAIERNGFQRLGGDGVDRPVLGVVEAPDARVQLGGDHADGSHRSNCRTSAKSPRPVRPAGPRRGGRGRPTMSCRVSRGGWRARPRRRHPSVVRRT
jgi:hypothetical protein